MVVYIIEFFDTDWFYIGSTKDFIKREKQHLWKLRTNKHYNPIMQRVFNKYPDRFCMSIIQEVEENEDVRAVEQIYLDSFKPNLNCSDDASYPTRSRKPKNYEVMTPTGEVITVTDVLNFCESNNLDFSEFYKVARSQRGSFKGYRVLKVDDIPTNFKNKTETEEYKKRNKEVVALMHSKITKEGRSRTSLALSKRYLITTPDNIQFCIIGLNYFCKDRDLDVSHLAKVARGIRKHCKQYRCEEIV